MAFYYYEEIRARNILPKETSQKEVIGMNNNQKLFCHEYVKNGNNGTRAYMEVYKVDEETAMASASRLLRNDKVKEYIESLQKELKEDAIMSAKERMEWLTEVVKDIQREVTSIRTADEEIILGDKNADLNTKIKAIDIMNKMTGEYVTKVEGNVGITKLEDVL